MLAPTPDSRRDRISFYDVTSSKTLLWILTPTLDGGAVVLFLFYFYCGIICFNLSGPITSTPQLRGNRHFANSKVANKLPSEIIDKSHNPNKTSCTELLGFCWRRPRGIVRRFEFEAFVEKLQIFPLHPWELLKLLRLNFIQMLSKRIL